MAWPRIQERANDAHLGLPQREQGIVGFALSPSAGRSTYPAEGVCTTLRKGSTYHWPHLAVAKASAAAAAYAYTRTIQAR